MARNIGVLIRQTKLLGNGNQSCLPGLVHHRKLVSSSIQTLTLTLSSIPSSIPSSSSPIMPLSSTLKLPFSYNYYSLIHSQNLHFMRHTDPDSDEGPSNFVLVQDPMLYNEALRKARDERISAVFFYTTPCCWRTYKWFINPIFDQMRGNEKFLDIDVYVVYLEQDGMRMTLDQLGVKSQTFHFYLEGEKVDELASPSVSVLKKTLANVYNPSGMKNTRRHAKKDKNDEGFVEVFPSSFPASSIPKVMEAVESLPEGAANDRLWCFAKGLFSSQEKREEFSSIENPYLKLEWLKREVGG